MFASSTREIPEPRDVPRHVAIIMDGNGRWAKQRLLPRVAGHRRGVEAVRAIVRAAVERGIGFLTLFAFSSENWRRPADEVSILMELFLRSLEVEVGKHANPMGTLHGGVLCDLGDLTMGTAVGSTLGRGETFTTIELKVNFFKPVRDGRIEATARIVKRTRSVCFVECDVVDAKGSLVARLGSTCMILRGEQAAGR